MQLVCESIPGGLTLMELEPQSCRFPIGDPRTDEFRFCGAHRLIGSAYCGFHREVCMPTVTRSIQKEAA